MKWPWHHYEITMKFPWSGSPTFAEVSIPFFVLSFCFIHTGEAGVLGMWREAGRDPGRQKQMTGWWWLGVSENSVALNPMVNDHYPY